MAEQVRRQDQGVWSGVECQDPCGHTKAAVAVGEFALQAGRVEYGTPFQLALEWVTGQVY